MLKTLGVTKSKTQPGDGGVGVDINNRAGHGRSEIGGSRINNVEVDGSEVEVDEIGKKV